MKVRSLLFGMLCMLALSASLVSCSDEDDVLDDSGSTVSLPQVRAYFLNEGTQKENNAGIMFYAPNGDAASISDIFKKQNNAQLGDVGQDMIVYEECLYVAVYGSNYLVKLNAAGVVQKRVSFVGDADLSAGIRSIAAEDGYIYASFYGGTVAKIDANTLQVEKKLTGVGSNLEGVAISERMLYVADSYKVVDSKYVYNKEVAVIDLNTFSLKEKLTVTQNPNMMTEEDGRVYLISWDYSAESYLLQMIEPKNGNKVSQLGYATHMAAKGDLLYLVDSRVDYSHWPEVSARNSFATYDAKSGKMNAT
ncbi:YncE family protein, partial [Bacteroides heparinolyticus]